MEILDKITDLVSEKEEKFTEDFKPSQMRLWKFFTFIMVFLSFSLTLHFLLWVNWNTIFFQKSTASMVSYLLSLSGVSSKSSGIYVIIENLGVIKIVKDCLGWKSMLALTGLILATRGIEIKERFHGIFLGLVLVQGFNILRLFTTFYIVVAYSLNFEIVHSFIWRWGLTFLVLGIWLIWLRLVRS